MRKPKIINSNNESQEDFSSYCPKCGCHMIEKGSISPADFDESGWFNVQNFKCLDRKCGHTWGEKVILVTGGHLHKYSF